MPRTRGVMGLAGQYDTGPSAESPRTAGRGWGRPTRSNTVADHMTVLDLARRRCRRASRPRPADPDLRLAVERSDSARAWHAFAITCSKHGVRRGGDPSTDTRHQLAHGTQRRGAYTPVC